MKIFLNIKVKLKNSEGDQSVLTNLNYFIEKEPGNMNRTKGDSFPSILKMVSKGFQRKQLQKNRCSTLEMFHLFNVKINHRLDVSRCI